MRPVRILAMLSLAASAWLLGIGAGEASAAPVLAAQCTGTPTATLSVFSGQRLAQTFISQSTGDVARGELEISKPPASTGNWTMEIFAVDGGTGIPTTPIASTTIADATVPDGNSRISGTFAPGVSLQAGGVYALSLARSSTWTLRDRSDVCDGREFRSLTSTGAWSNDGGYVGAPFDTVFAAYVEPPAAPAAPATQAPPPPSALTGLQGAALNRCKKLAKKRGWSQQRLRKCRSKARLLPL